MYLSVDVDIDEIISSMSFSDKKVMFEALCENLGIDIPDEENPLKNKRFSYDENKLRENCSKLISNYISLTSEELEIIENISSKLV